MAAIIAYKCGIYMTWLLAETWRSIVLFPKLGDPSTGKGKRCNVVSVERSNLKPLM